MYLLTILYISFRHSQYEAVWGEIKIRQFDSFTKYALEARKRNLRKLY